MAEWCGQVQGIEAELRLLIIAILCSRLRYSFGTQIIPAPRLECGEKRMVRERLTVFFAMTLVAANLYLVLLASRQTVWKNNIRRA